MIQFQRVTANGTGEVWYLHAAIQKLYQLAEAHCEFDHNCHTATIKVFVAENCPRHRDLVDYFIDQIVPGEYEYIVAIYSRGMLVDAWNSVECQEPTEPGEPYERVARLLGSKAFLA